MDRSRRHPRLFAPVALLSLLAVALSGVAQAGQALEEKFEKSYAGTGIDRLRLQNVNGAVRVGTWEKAEIRVSAVKRAKGAGAEMRMALGVAVFSGMLGVTVFGIFFTPVFYSVVRWLAGGRGPVTDTPQASPQAPEHIPALDGSHQ